MIQFGVLLLAQLLLAQAFSSPQTAKAARAGDMGQPRLPCAYSGKILRDDNGKVVSFTSAEMKARATRKVDVGIALLGTVDFKAVFTYQVLVGPTGNIICLKRLKGFPAADAEVEKAVRQWKFKPADKNGQPVASTGVMDFYLCNMNCGNEGRSISLLN